VIPGFSVYLFDIDGTLLDSAGDICAAMRHALATVSEAPAVSEAYLRSFIGRNMIDLFQEVFPNHAAGHWEQLFQHYRICYRERGHRQTRVFPGVAEALSALSGRKSTATAKGTPTTRSVLELFGLGQYFDHVQGTDGFPGKPAPDVILKALDALGAQAEDCLMVGDSAADMEAGKRAGVRTCAVRYGYGAAEDLARFAPDFWVDDLRELLPGFQTKPQAPGFSTGIPLDEAANGIKTEQIIVVEMGKTTPKIS